MKKNNFTMIDNSILDVGLSLEAIGLYVQIQRHATKTNWQIKRDFFKKVSGLGEVAFRRVWKELIDKGLLNRVIERIKGKFNYVFTLVTGEKEANKKADKGTKSNKKTLPKDSDGEVPLENQIHMGEVLAEKVQETKPENVENENSIEDKLIKETGANKERVTSAINYAKDKGAKNVYFYALKTIENNWDKYGITLSHIKSNKVNNANFTQREYDYDQLESELLGYSLEDECNDYTHIPALPDCIGTNIENEEEFGNSEYISANSDLEALFGI
ncbi:hypothetical protein [Clostridium perfringens]|uniref:hypothetical protein n=1 Tax=Clostridium perfringens TaxID=1502 RepID=UPI001A1B4132|nr:hypothetical protein [Clostridium perfringens]MDK0862625.1 hypothetical protein [Clostridium perfringens]MDM0532299.1 hypothetical protein [Clostridium perfringens]MDM0620078.1 hypothetical protein [Clostridium perfringens]MDZ5061941.1 hypothetical protein [Clostridium perfringens]HAT4258782.1 hypothetical protein [Clostridium perfringens]